MAETTKVLEILVKLRDLARDKLAKLDEELNNTDRSTTRISKTLKKLEKISKKTFKVMGTAAVSMKKKVLSLKTAVAGLTILYTSKKLIDASNAQAEAVAGMETALRSMGRYTPELSQNLQELAASLQQVTNYGDEATIEGQKFLVTYGEITDDLLPKSTKVMLDLAALMGGDAVRAANMLGKASMGMVGELRRVGITVDADVYKLGGYVAILKQIEKQVKGQAEAQRKATGSLIALGNSVGDVAEKFGDVLKLTLEPLFSSLVKQADKLNAVFRRLLLDSEFRKILEEAGEDLKDRLESMSRKAFEVTKRIGSLLFGLFDEISRHPELVEYGLIGYFFFGKKGAAIGAVVGKIVSDTKEDLKSAREAVGVVEKFKALFRGGAEAPAIGFGSLLPGASLFLKKTKDISSSVRKSIDDTTSHTESKWSILLNKIKEEWGKDVVALPSPEIKEPKKRKPKEPSRLALDLLSKAEKDLLSLEVIYRRGELELVEYLEKRKALVLITLNEELEALKRAAGAETDTATRLKLKDEIYVKTEEYALKEIQLENDIEKAHKDATERKLATERLFQSLRFRAGSEREAQYTIELAELEARQLDELDRFKTLLNDKLAAELGYSSEVEALRAVGAAQEVERSRLLADQDRRIWEQKLTNAKTIASGISGIFQNLYELGGEKNKAMFYAAKAAALAEAIINVQLGMTKALGQGGIYGIALAAVVGAAGAINIGTILAQGLAEGGFVAGSSPTKTADNIPLRGTAGEFMQPVDSVQYYGAAVMEGLRKRLIPRELFTGLVSKTLPVMKPNYALAGGGMVASGPSSSPGTPPAEEQSLNIFNVLDVGEFERFLGTPRGERAVLNLMSSRQKKVQKIVRGG